MNYNTYVKERLADALMGIAREGGYESVSVKALAQAAQVSRASFYRNFKDKDDVLTFKLKSLYRSWASKHKEAIAIEAGFASQTKNFFEFMLAEWEMMTFLHDSGKTHILLTLLQDLIGPQEGDDVESALYRSFIVHGIHGIYVKWVELGAPLDPGRMAEFVTVEIPAANLLLLRGEAWELK